MPIPDFSNPEANFSYMPTTYTPSAPLETYQPPPAPTPPEEPGLIHEDPLGPLIGVGSGIIGGEGVFPIARDALMHGILDMDHD